MNIIEAYRLKHGIIQKEFADSIGISQPHLANIENSKRDISPDLALAIEKATKGEIKKEWLVFPNEYKEEIEQYLNKTCVGAGK